jgi:hypothetical protein
LFRTGGDKSNVGEAGAALEQQLLAQNVAAPEAARRRRIAEASVQSADINRSSAMAAGQLMMQNQARSLAGDTVGRQFIDDALARIHPDNAQAREQARGNMQYLGRTYGRADLGGDNTIAGFDRAGAASVVAGNEIALQATASALNANYHAAIRANDVHGAMEAISRMTSLRNAVNQNTPVGNKRIVHEMLQNAGVDTSAAESPEEQLAFQTHHNITGQAGGQAAWTAAGYGDPAPVMGTNAAGQQVQVGFNYGSLVEDIRNRAGLYSQGVGSRGPHPALGGGAGGGGVPPAVQQQQQQPPGGGGAGGAGGTGGGP